MIEWYILHVHLNKERKVAGILKTKLPSMLYRPFIPQKEKFFRRAGISSIVRVDCFPGYLFIESHTTSDVFLDNAKHLIWNIKEAYKLLSYDGKDNISLTETDMELLKQLLGDGDCIKVSKGNIVDGIIEIDSGALVGKENTIKKINRRQRMAEIEINFMGVSQHITVGLEILSKTSA